MYESLRWWPNLATVINDFKCWKTPSHVGQDRAMELIIWFCKERGMGSFFFFIVVWVLSETVTFRAFFFSFFYFFLSFFLFFSLPLVEAEKWPLHKDSPSPRRTALCSGCKHLRSTDFWKEPFNKRKPISIFVFAGRNLWLALIFSLQFSKLCFCMIARIPSSNTSDTFRLDNAFSPVLLGLKG